MTTVMKGVSRRRLCRGCAKRPAVYRDNRGGRVRFGRRANHDLCGQCWRSALEAARVHTADELPCGPQNDYKPSEVAKAATPSKVSSLMYEEFQMSVGIIWRVGLVSPWPTEFLSSIGS
jgi:hypothetical protein